MAISQETKMVRYIRYAIIALAVILLVLLFFFVQNYRTLRREQIVNAREVWLALVLKNHGPLQAANVDVIRPWMTFDYIDRLFNVPSDYLKAQLGIADSRYPRLSLSGYAKSEHLNAGMFTTQVQTALHDYLIMSTSTNATTTP